MERESVSYCIELALRKKKTLDASLVKYLTRAALASIYLGFILILCIKLAELFRLRNCNFKNIVTKLIHIDGCKFR